MLCSARPRKAPSAWGDVEDFEGDWRGIRRGAAVGRTVSELFQSAAGRRLCRISAHALAERIRRSRTGRLENRQPAAANNGLRKATTPDRAKSRNASPFSPHVEPHNDGIVNDPEIKAEARDLAVDLSRVEFDGHRPRQGRLATDRTWSRSRTRRGSGAASTLLSSRGVRSLAPLWAVGSAALALATWVCFQVGLNSATTGYVFLIIIVLLSIMDSLISSIFFSVIAVGVASRYHGRGARGRHLASGGVTDRPNTRMRAIFAPDGELPSELSSFALQQSSPDQRSLPPCS